MKKFIDYSNPNSIGSRLRAKRIKPLLSIIESIHEKNGRVNILDIGGTRKYWTIIPHTFLEQKNVHITTINISVREAIPEDEMFSYMQGDACDLSGIADNAYDIAHSNSVIEHVGDRARMEQFAREVRRLSRIYYVQTPYFWFPMEPHCMTLFFHWLPKSLRVFLVMRFSLGNWKRQDTTAKALKTVESARLLDIKMFKTLFPDAKMKIEWLLFLPKSLIAIKRN